MLNGRGILHPSNVMLWSNRGLGLGLAAMIYHVLCQDVCYCLLSIRCWYGTSQYSGYEGHETKPIIGCRPIKSHTAVMIMGPANLYVNIATIVL